MLNNENGSIGRVEFILMMASLMALGALPIDAILPALPNIGHDIYFENVNSLQYIISSMMLGSTFGQLIYGPMADSFGRKRATYWGLSLYIIGCIGSIFAFNSYMMIGFRFLQGLGVVSTRVVVTAIVRDIYKGKEMAKLMGVVVSIFVFIPAIAPAFGQIILKFYSWHAIFVSFIITTALCVTWMSIRLPETLNKEFKRKFTLGSLKDAFLIVVSNKVVMLYILIMGLSFGAFLGYLVSAQSIFHDYFKVGDMFAVYFSVTAFSIGIASLLNTRIVHHFSLIKIAMTASAISSAISISFMTVFFDRMSDIPLPAFMIYMGSVMLCAGFMFGNVNALAMEPLGKVAGMASSVIGMLSTLISVFMGSIIGQMYKGSLEPVIAGYLFGYIAILLLLKLVYSITKRDIIIAP